MSEFTPNYNGGGAPATMANALKACRSDITYIKEDLKPGSRRHRAIVVHFFGRRAGEEAGNEGETIMKIEAQRLRNLTTSRLHTDIGCVYEDLGIITGETGLMTHMLPRAMGAVEPWLLAHVKLCHPDQPNGAHDKMIRLNQAWDMARQHYNR